MHISDIKEEEKFSNLTMKLLDPQEFKRQGYMVIDFIAEYYQNIEKHPVRSQVPPGHLIKQLPNAAPRSPEPFESILKDVQNHIVPGLTHWQSPNFFAYFPLTAFTAGILGETLAAGFNVVGLNWITSPAATELEMVVTNWLGGMLQLPKSLMFSGGTGGGVLLGTTCEAILCTLVAARDRVLDRIGKENVSKLVVYGSDQTHSCFEKSARIAGINPQNIRAIKTTKTDLYGLQPKSYKMVVESDIKAGLFPVYLCATVGTTALGAVDPLGPLCLIAKEYDIWVHVDAAYAGSAAICPEFRHFINGVEDASSFSFNAHKCLLANMDCCCLWVKYPSALTKALGSNPEFLRNTASESKEVVDYKDWQVALSRRFRALKLWFVLRSYGVDNLRAFIRNRVDMAMHLEGLVTLDHRFELVMPRCLSLVCFRISPESCRFGRQHQNGSNGNINGSHDTGLKELDVVNELNYRLLESANSTGRVHVSHAAVDGVFFIRFAVGATLTERQHVLNAWKLIQDHADTILALHTQNQDIVKN